MTVKEYLRQVFKLDKQINSKIEMLSELNSLATKCTQVLTGMPHNPSGSKHSMEDTIIKIITLQEEINKDIDTLVDLKTEIMHVISSVPDSDCRVLLEKRYLSFKTWEDIAEDMNYGLRYIHILHKKALAMAESFIGEDIQTA